MKTSMSWRNNKMAFHTSAINRRKIKFKLKLNIFSFLTIPFLILLLFMVVLPFFFVIFYSLTSIEDSFLYLTFDNFVAFCSDPSFWNKLGLSIYFATVSTIICLIIGYPISYFISRTSPKIRNISVILITLPMWVNMLLRIYGLKSLLQMFTEWTNIPIVGTDIGVIIGEVFTSLPFMIIPIYTQLLKLDSTLLEASKDLGSSSFKTFMKVTLPISTPGIISGITMVFLPAITSIVIPKYMGNGKPRYQLIGNLIESYYIRANNTNKMCAMALIMTVIILLVICLVKLLDFSEVKQKGRFKAMFNLGKKAKLEKGVN